MCHIGYAGTGTQHLPPTGTVPCSEDPWGREAKGLALGHIARVCGEEAAGPFTPVTVGHRDESTS